MAIELVEALTAVPDEITVSPTRPATVVFTATLKLAPPAGESSTELITLALAASNKLTFSPTGDKSVTRSRKIAKTGTVVTLTEAVVGSAEDALAFRVRMLDSDGNLLDFCTVALA